MPARFKNTRFHARMSSACNVSSVSPAMAASLPASVSIANGARAIAPAPHQPINGENILADVLKDGGKLRLGEVTLTGRQRQSAARISARMSALVGPRETRAAGAALTYSTPRLCALLMTERETLANSSANALALARLRGAASRMRCSIALV